MAEYNGEVIPLDNEPVGAKPYIGEVTPLETVPKESTAQPAMTAQQRYRQTLKAYHDQGTENPDDVKRMPLYASEPAPGYVSPETSKAFAEDKANIPELGAQWGDVGKGAAKGIPATLLGGIAGDIEELGRTVLSPFGVKKETFIPTTLEGGYLGPRGLNVMDPAKTKREAAGMMISSMFAPIGGAKVPGLFAKGIKEFAPSAELLKNTAVAAYKSPEVAALKLHPDAMRNFGEITSANLTREGFDPLLAPKTYGLLEKVTVVPEGQSFVTANNFQVLRRKLGKAAESADKTERQAARIAQSSLDEFMPAITENLVLEGNLSKASGALEDARKNYAAASRSERLQEALSQAEKQAARSGFGGNLENSTRQRISSILNSPAKKRGFSQEEISELENYVKGNFTRNSVRTATKILGGDNPLMAAVHAGLAFPTHGLSLAAPITGYVLKRLNDAMSSRQLSRIDNIIRSRSPLAKQTQSAIQDWSQAGAGLHLSNTAENAAKFITSAQALNDVLGQSNIKANLGILSTPFVSQSSENEPPRTIPKITIHKEPPRATGGSVFDKMHMARKRAEGGGTDVPFNEWDAVPRNAEGIPQIRIEKPPVNEADEAQAAREAAAARIAGNVRGAPYEPTPPSTEGKTWMMEPGKEAVQSGNYENTLPPNVRLNDAGIPYNVETGEELQMARRPSVLPLTRTPDGVQWAMPKIAELAGDIVNPLAVTKGVALNPGEFALGSGPIKRSVLEQPNAPTFYSALDRAVTDIPQAKASAEQWSSTFLTPESKKLVAPRGPDNRPAYGPPKQVTMPETSPLPGVKPEEIKWRGLDQYLAGRAGQTVTKQEIADHLAGNKVELGSVQKGISVKEPQGKVFWTKPDGTQAQMHDGSSITSPNSAYRDDVVSGRAIWNDENGKILTNDEALKRANQWQDYWEIRDNKGGKYSTKYQGYQLPGGENYSEKLLTLPNQWEAPRAAQVANEAKIKALRQEMHGTSGTNEIRAEIRSLQDANAALQKQISASPIYKSPHWDEPNPVTHMRSNERTIGNTASHHIEEVQSDWHQKGRTEGYADPAKRDIAARELLTAESELKKQSAGQINRNYKEAIDNQVEFYANPELDVRFAEQWFGETPEQQSAALRYMAAKREFSALGGVPDAPFKKTWPDLTMKQALRDAVENGKDRLSWTPGEAQAERYDLSKHYEGIRAARDPETGEYAIWVMPKGEKYFYSAADSVPPGELPNYIGKDLADKIHGELKYDKGNGKEWPRRSYEGLDLKVGGEGMNEFYDKMLPKAVEKLGKAYGVKVQRGVDTTGNPVNYVDIPPAWKQEILKKGFPLFASGGSVFDKMHAAKHMQQGGGLESFIKSLGSQGAAFGTQTEQEQAGFQRDPISELGKGAYNAVEHLAKENIDNANLLATGNRDQFSGKPGLEAAMLTMGTGAVAGVPMRAREFALGSGPIRNNGQVFKSAAEGGEHNVAARPNKRASAEDINRAADESAGMTQAELRALYNELGITGTPPSSLVKPALADQPKSAIDAATSMKLEDIAAMNKLSKKDRELFVKGKLPNFVLPSQEAAAPARIEFDKVRKEIKKAETEFDLLRATGDEPRLFDLSSKALNKVPDVDQFRLPRVEPKITERLQPAYAGGAGLKRLERAAEKASSADYGWYQLQQVRDMMNSVHGPKKGEMVWNAWLDSLAGTSMVNPISSNVRGSTYYLREALSGRPLPQSIPVVDPKTGNVRWTLAGAPEAGYGAKAQIQHADRVREFMAHEGDPIANPKPMSYRQNLGGNWMPRTVDTHDIRNAVGMPHALTFGENAGLLPGEYAALEQLGEKAASRSGVPQAAQQAATWIGGGAYTKLKSIPIPLLNEINRRIHVTAKINGVAPDVLWRDVLRGKEILKFAGGSVFDKMKRASK